MQGYCSEWVSFQSRCSLSQQRFLQEAVVLLSSHVYHKGMRGSHRAWSLVAQRRRVEAIEATRIRSYMTFKKTSRSRVKLGKVVSSKYPLGSNYEVDLSTMKQINLTTGYTRDIKVVDAHATASAPAELDGIKEELRACRQELGVLKKLMHELKADTVVVKMTTSKNTAKEVAALASSPYASGE